MQADFYHLLHQGSQIYFTHGNVCFHVTFSILAFVLSHWEVQYIYTWCFPGGSVMQYLPAMWELQEMRVLQEMQVRSLCQDDPLEEGMATHYSILA